MDIEKLKKLIFSGNFEDVRIGVEYISSFGKKSKDIFLRLGGERASGKDEEFSYIIRFKNHLPNTVNDEFLDVYIAKKYYYYEIYSGGIYMDTPQKAKKRIKDKDSTILADI